MSAQPDPPPRLDDSELVEALQISRRLGMLGAAPIAEVIEHSAAFLVPLVDVTGTVVDLGSGGGVPGLVVAWMRRDLDVVLVDRRATRTDHLQRLVHRLRLSDTVAVLTTEATALPRLLPTPASAVIARSFGAPLLVLAAASPILTDDGIVVVSAPPSDTEGKWPAALLERHGFVRVDGEPQVVVLRRRNDSR